MFRDTISEHRVTTNGRGYAYISHSTSARTVVHRQEALALSRSILNPKLNNPDFLVLRNRREIFAKWFSQVPGHDLKVLDVGGRLQPYRPLLGDRIEQYIAIDPVFEGLLDVAGVGERLPFRSNSFDLALCTQVLNYAAAPEKVINEIYRVLKPGGTIFVSAPAIFPRLHDQRWRFMPDGLELLLSAFSNVEVVPEGQSIAGFFRCINWFFESFLRGPRTRRLAHAALYPVFNLAGLKLDRLSRGRSNFATNYSCRARKPTFVSCAMQRAMRAGLPAPIYNIERNERRSGLFRRSRRGGVTFFQTVAPACLSMTRGSVTAQYQITPIPFDPHFDLRILFRRTAQGSSRVCAGVFPLFSSFWPTHADAFQTNNLLWPQGTSHDSEINRNGPDRQSWLMDPTHHHR